MSARFLGASAAVAGVLVAANLLLSDVQPVAGPFVRCSGSACPSNPFNVLSVGSGVGDALSKAHGLATAVILAAVAILLARRAVRSTPLRRRSLVPLLTWAVLAALGFGFYVAVRALDSDADVLMPAAVAVAAIISAMPLAIAVGIARGRVFAMSALERVVAELERTSSLTALERTMSRAFADPALRLLRWVPQSECYVDTDGERVDVSMLAGAAGRRITTWEGRGESRAALVHDPILAEDVVRAAGSALRLALDNARLQDDLVSSIGELEASRQRVASAVDEERRRIELDLHDGAQQRLIALRFQLQVIEEVAAQNPQSLGSALADAGRQVDTAINQIRRLAKGIYPAVLRDFGLSEALIAAARELPIDVAVHAARAGPRFAPEIETAVYFCCLEALQNAAKHGGPDVRADVRLAAREDNVRFAVADDGPGFDPAEPVATRGITGMRDRLAAVGGRLTIASEPGRGTTVSGTVPIAAR